MALDPTADLLMASSSTQRSASNSCGVKTGIGQLVVVGAETGGQVFGVLIFARGSACIITGSLRSAPQESAG